MAKASTKRSVDRQSALLDRGRQTMNLEIPPEGQDAINSFCEKTGIPKKTVVSRVLTWFGRQGETIQSAIVGTLPSDARVDIARIMLGRLASGEDENQPATFTKPLSAAKDPRTEAMERARKKSQVES